MMTCRELVDVLFDLVDGQLPREQSPAVAHHLRQCRCCTAYIESYRFLVHRARRLPDTPLPPELAQRLQTLLEAYRAAARASGRSARR